MIGPGRIPRGVVLDTGPLLDLLLIVGCAGPSVGPAHFRSEVRRRGLQELVQSCRRRCTTPHVLAEIEGHIRRMGLGEPRERQVRASAFTFLAALGLAEHTRAFEMAPREIRDRLGLTDAVLLEIANEEGLTLLTTDLTLHAVAHARDVAAMAPWELEVLARM